MFEATATLTLALFGESREVSIKRNVFEDGPAHYATTDAMLAWRVGFSGEKVYNLTPHLVPLDGDRARYAALYRSSGTAFVASDGVEYGVQLSTILPRGRGREARAFGWADKHPRTAF